VNAHVRDGFLPETVLRRAGRRETDDRLPAIVAATRGADPDITLQAICTQLEAMRQLTPRRRISWQPSSVKMLLERAERLGYCHDDSKVRSSPVRSTGGRTTTCRRPEPSQLR